MRPHRALLGLALALPLAAQASGDEPGHPLARGRIGVEVQPLTPELREHFGAPAERGVLVARVEAERPAARAGLRVGDVVTEAGEVAVARPLDLVRAVASVPAGEGLVLQLVRGGEPQRLTVAPEGEAWLFADPERFEEEMGAWLRRGLRHGSEELRRRLESLERRLDEIEKRMDAPAQRGVRGVDRRGSAPTPL